MARIWFGTSGFSYKEWKPIFYPPDIPEKQFLRYYSGRLNSVEIDYTFYRIPSATTIENWKAATPETFKFTVKATQQITHRERLKTPSETAEYFLTVVRGLDSRLGMVLYQLPPFFKCDVQRLEAFLAVLPRGIAAAFEFRHESPRAEAYGSLRDLIYLLIHLIRSFDHARVCLVCPLALNEVYELLHKHGIGLCIHDADDHTTPMELTAPYTYIRLRRSEYTDKLRREWQDRIRAWAEAGTEVFAYIKHEDNPNAPLIALEFAKAF